MLYVTTRNTTDVHTAHHALVKDRSAEQGLYVPFRLPQFSVQDLEMLSQRSFSENVCYLLKLFLGKELNPWDVDYAIGRKPVRLIPLSHKILAAETWRNLDWEYSRLEKVLMGKILGQDVRDVYASSWAKIAVRISTVFGLFTLAVRKKMLSLDTPIDVAMEEGDLCFAISVLYCRKMGLPIGNIVCSCLDNSLLWELYHTGQMQPAAIEKMPSDQMERLIFEMFDADTAFRYVQSRKLGIVFQLTQQQIMTLHSSVSAVVVSDSRAKSIIPSVYRTVGYILAPGSALAYGGLLDYRSRSGERRPALLLTQQGPFCQLEFVAKCMDLTPDTLKERIFSK